MTKQLNEAETKSALADLDDWEPDGTGCIRGVFEFDSADRAQDFCNGMAKELGAAKVSTTGERVLVVLPKEGSGLTQTELNLAADISAGSVDYLV